MFSFLSMIVFVNFVFYFFTKSDNASVYWVSIRLFPINIFNYKKWKGNLSNLKYKKSHNTTNE